MRDKIYRNRCISCELLTLFSLTVDYHVYLVLVPVVKVHVQESLLIERLPTDTTGPL